jgi:alpha-tubulin suppressor-like RCC1 family protein
MEVEEVSALPVMEMTMTMAAAAADEDPMVDIEVEEEEHNNNNRHNNNNNNNKRWAEARLAPGEHLLKRNKRSIEEDRNDDGQQPTSSNINIINSNNIINNNDAVAGPSSEDAGELAGGEEQQREAGLTGSGDEWYTIRKPRMVDLESPVDSEWGEGESSLAELSDEVLLHVFKCGLAQGDLHNISLVCRRWWALSQDHLLRRSLGKGKVFVIGCGQYGQLGLGQRIDQLDKPALIQALDQIKIKRVCAARRHSVVLDSEGRVYSFGSGEDGKLGHGNELDQLSPKQIVALQGHKIIDASCGVHHTLLVSEAGRLFSFGFAACGQLGHADQSNRTVPTEVKALANEKIVACAAGAHHSLAVTGRGTVYSFGLGHTGQLGHGDENFQMITYQLTPKLIASLQGVKIVSAAAGFFNSLLIADDGRVFSFGSGGNGKLGHGDQANQLVPKQVGALGFQKVVRVSAGPCHTLALTAQGRVFSFGNGQNGRLGHGDEQYAFAPRMVVALQHERVIDISAGECHSLALTDAGRVYFFGASSTHRAACVWADRAMVGNANHHGHTATGPRWLEASKYHRVVGLAAGGTHSLLYT